MTSGYFYSAPRLQSYDMSGKKIMVIFCHFKFKETYGSCIPTELDNHGRDITTLTELFRGLGFDVTPYIDLDNKHILEVVKNLNKQDHSKTSCLAIVILTHGGPGGTLCAADGVYHLSDIMSVLEESPNLAKKPKLVFVQACRGTMANKGVKPTQYDSGEHEQLIVPTHADYLITYSCPEGYVSYINKEGSWMIQEVCNAIRENHNELDLLHMITLANESVAQRVSNTEDEKFNKKKQIMETRFTLTKLLWLSSTNTNQ